MCVCVCMCVREREEIDTFKRNYFMDSYFHGNYRHNNEGLACHNCYSEFLHYQ